MEALISLIPLLVCPMLMGLMAWMMTHQKNEQADITQAKTSLWHDLKRMARSCFNPKVALLMVIVGFGLYLTAPAFFYRFAPWLLILICPISMTLTMRQLYRQISLTEPNLTRKPELIEHERRN